MQLLATRGDTNTQGFPPEEQRGNCAAAAQCKRSSNNCATMLHQNIALCKAAFTLYATRRGRMIGFQWNQQDRSHYARRDATSLPELAPVPK